MGSDPRESRRWRCAVCDRRRKSAARPCQLWQEDNESVQQDRLAHQDVVRAEEFVHLFHGGFAGDQVVDVAPERLSELAADESLAPAGFVDDFVAAKAL